MPKEAISVTLERQNLAWLRGQVRLTGARSVSEVLDRVVAAHRSDQSRWATAGSVKGSIRIAADDPDLACADAALSAPFEQPSAQPGSRRRLPTPA